MASEPKTTKQTVVLGCDTLIALKTLAVKTGKTQGEIMTAAIEEYLERHEKETEQPRRTIRKI